MGENSFLKKENSDEDNLFLHFNESGCQDFSQNAISFHILRKSNHWLNAECNTYSDTTVDRHYYTHYYIHRLL